MALTPVNTVYNGREINIKARGKLTLYAEIDGYRCADYLLQTYQFLKDITPKVVHAPQKEVREARGKQI